MEDFIVNFSELFEEENISDIRPETKFKELDEWSSIMSLNVIAMIDEKYGVQIVGKDLRESETISDLFNKIKNLSRPVLWGAAAACCVAVLVSVFYPRQTQSEGYMYFNDSIYTQVGNIETDIDTLLEDIDSYL